MYGDTSAYGDNGGFGRFAPFFRNYNRPSIEVEWPTYDANNTNGGTPVEVGQYKFGYNSSTWKPWLRELTWITTKPLTGTNSPSGGFLRADDDGTTFGSSATPLDPKKIADKNNYRSRGYNREAEFNAAGEQIAGDVWFIDKGPLAYTAYSNKLNWHDAQFTAKTGDSFGIKNSQMDFGIGGIYQAQDDTNADGIAA